MYKFIIALLLISLKSNAQDVDITNLPGKWKQTAMPAGFEWQQLCDLMFLKDSIMTYSCVDSRKIRTPAAAAAWKYIPEKQVLSFIFPKKEDVENADHKQQEQTAEYIILKLSADSLIFQSLVFFPEGGYAEPPQKYIRPDTR